MNNLTLPSFELLMRENIVKSARGLYESKVSFAIFYYSRCNETFWSLTNEGGFQLKGNVTPADAIKDIYINGSLYACECATAMMIVLYKATIDTIGIEAFNNWFTNIYLWDWEGHNHLPLTGTQTYGHGMPGDIRYFKNPAVNPKTPQWQGENTIDLGDGQFYGHGVGIMTAENIVAELNKNRREGADKSAFLMEKATTPEFSILATYQFQGPGRRSNDVGFRVGPFQYQ